MVAPSRNFFISFEIKPDVTFSDFTTKKRIFTTFWFQNCKNCKVLLPWSRSIWKEYLWFLPLCKGSMIVILCSFETLNWISRFSQTSPFLKSFITIRSVILLSWPFVSRALLMGQQLLVFFLSYKLKGIKKSLSWSN